MKAELKKRGVVRPVLLGHGYPHWGSGTENAFKVLCKAAGEGQTIYGLTVGVGPVETSSRWAPTISVSAGFVLTAMRVMDLLAMQTRLVRLLYLARPCRRRRWLRG